MGRRFKNLKVFSLILCFFISISCTKYLDRTIESEISDEEAFKDFKNFQGFVEEFYTGIPDFTNAYWTNSWNWGDDEVTSGDMDYHIVNMFDLGNFWGWQSEHNGWSTSWMDKADNNIQGDRFTKSLWPNGWYTIRKANLGLENLDKLHGTQEEKDLIEGQLLFFRAWYYFQFMQYFGGLPYLKEPLAPDGVFEEVRLNYQATADSAADDFRRAADLLPISWDDTQVGKSTLGNNDLRINKIMALSYLGKNLLWAGSPLMNRESTGIEGYNQEYCKKAADVLGEVLSLCESGDAPYSLVSFSNYSDLFYTVGKNWRMPGSTEAIFRGPYYHADQSNWGTSKQYQPDVIQDAGNFFPTANYVNNFGMENGLPLDDPNSGFDPEFPWRDRDPRFYSDFIFDGVKTVQGSMPEDEESNRYANLHSDGSYRGAHGGSPTGYLLYKFIPIKANKFDQGNTFGDQINIHLPWLRLAEVYIMYSEASAQGYQSPTGRSSSFDMTAIEAINVIRDRAGVGNVGSNYSSNLEDFMSELRREWAVELAFEKHRFTNLRRWLLITEEPYLNKTAIEFDRAPSFSFDDPQNNRVLNYREKTIISREYTEKHYWLPFKRKDVNISPDFKQNPGW